MKYRRLGDTELKVSEIGFGAWTIGTDWWGKIDEASSQKLLEEALEVGINFFDTADVYGKGKSEELIGRLIQGRREEFVIATKFGYDFYSNVERKGHEEYPQNFTPSFIEKALEKSLERLGTDYVDLYQIHNPKMTILQDDEIFRTLAKLKDDGKIRYFGAALGPAIGWLEEGMYAMEQRGAKSIQTVYNILEQDPGREFFKMARKTGTGVLVRVPHASGLLEGKFDSSTVFAENDHRSHRKREWMLEGLRKVKQLEFLTRERTMAQVALRFVLAERTVASVLPTITSMDDLLQFAGASDVPDLTKEELARVSELYENDFYLRA